MNWLHPIFLVGLAALAIPLALHLFKRKPVAAVPFPSLRFLARNPRRTRKHTRWRRRIVLALRCLILAAAAAAFARPFLKTTATESRRALVVVVDSSFELQGSARWSAMVAWAKQKIGTPGPDDTLGLLASGPRPHWLLAPSSETSGALALLDHLEPGWTAARIEPALRLASDVLSTSPAAQRQLIYLGDYQRTTWAGTDFSVPLAAGVTPIFPPTSLSASRQASLLDPVLSRTGKHVQADLTIKNFTGAQRRTLRVYRAENKIPVHEEVIELGDRQTRTLRVELEPGTEPWTSFRFALDPDDIPADDSAYAVWRDESDRLVLVDANPDPGTADYLSDALASTSAIKPALTLKPVPSGPWPSSAIIFLRNDSSFAPPAVARLDDFIHAGGSAVIFVAGTPAQTRWLESTHALSVKPLEARSTPLELGDWTIENPLVAAIAQPGLKALVGWDFSRGWALPPQSVEALAMWSPAAAAIGEVGTGSGRLLICGFTPDRRASEWPVAPSFVPFLHHAAAYLVGASATRDAVSHVGQAIKSPDGEGSWRGVLGPATQLSPIAQASAIEPSAPGIYEQTQAGAARGFAVNVSPEGSDPAQWSEGSPWQGLASPAPAVHPALSLQPLADEEAEHRSPWWWWLIAGLVMITFAELGIANRSTR